MISDKLKDRVLLASAAFAIVATIGLAVALWLTLWFHGDERVSQPPSAPSGLTVRTE